MLPFEKIRPLSQTPTTGELSAAASRVPTSPLRADAVDYAQPPQSPSLRGSYRPHSRPHEPNLSGHVARQRAIMLPSSPTKHQRSTSHSPIRDATGGKSTAIDETDAAVGSPPRALVVSRDTRLPVNSETDLRSTASVPLPDLTPRHEVTLNLKLYDVNRPLPNVQLAKAFPPKFIIDAPHGNVLIRPPGDATATGLVTIPSFCRFVVDANEAGGDRCLQYHVFVDAPEMFSVQPTVSVDGTLTFATSPGLLGSSCNAWVRLADNASVSREGEIATSEPVPFVFNVLGRGASTKPLPTIRDWHSFKSKAHAACVPVSSLKEKEGKSTKKTPDRYSFPVNNIHELREQGLDAPAATSSDVRDQRVYLNYMNPPAFFYAVNELELLRFAPLMIERDRLGGEAVPMAQRQALEQELRETIRQAEAANSGSKDALLAAVTRLAQLSLLKGARGLGDARELFEKALRLRMDDVGISSLSDSAAVNRLCSGTVTEQQVESLLQTAIVLVSVLKHTARFAEGLEFAQDAANLAKRCLGRDHHLHLRALGQVGELLFSRGDYNSALDVESHAMELSHIVLGKESSTTTSLQHVVGVCLMALGRTDQSLKLHTAALEVREDVFRKAEEAANSSTTVDHTAMTHLAFLVAESLAWVTRCAHQAGDLNAASVSAEQCRTILARYDVSHSPEYAVAWGSIATVLASVERDGNEPLKAARLLQKASGDIALCRGEDSVEGAVVGIHYAVAIAAGFFVSNGNLQPPSALELEHVGMFAVDFSPSSVRSRLIRSAQILVSTFGQFHALSVKALCVLAHIEACLGLASPANALASTVKGLAAAKKIFRDDHHDVANILYSAGRIAIIARDYSAASGYLEQALDIVNRHSTLSQHRVPIFTDLCLVYGRRRSVFGPQLIAQAEDEYTRVKTSLGESSTACLEPLQNMAEVLFSCGQFERAHHFLSKALKIADSGNMIFLLGPLFKPAAQLSAQDLNERNRLAAKRLDSPSAAAAFAAVLFSIAATFEAQSRRQEAQNTFLQVIAALELAQMHTGVKTAVTFRALGTLLMRDGFYGDALAYCEKALSQLLDNHPWALDQIREVQSVIDAIDKQLQACGYILTRHTNSRYRFTVFM